MYDVFIMDMGGHDANVQTLAEQFPHAKIVRYYDNHLDTIRRCISKARTPWIWVIASCCDYTDFDFHYRAVPWESYQLHCWHSGYEKFGDTFLINVDEFKKQWDIALLEWYKEVNWHYPGVPRLPWPVLTTATEDVTTELKNYKFETPYVWINQAIDFYPPLWNKRAFYSFNDTGSISIAPRDIQAHLQSQIYDYPYIIKQKTAYLTPNLLDIIYISNGEPEAERWYEHLVNTCGREVKRVMNVDGRALAYKAAAELSLTPWFFTVFAKLEVIPEFNWSWQPDWLQEPKHYIFNSRNPVNGLEYGHQGMIAYNKRLVLENNTPGIDFTLSQAHEVVPILSGVANYHYDAWTCWRTAFRECIKLQASLPDVESQYRLTQWLTKDTTDGQWSLKGAEDAVEYYNSVNGDFTELKRSYDWAWLSSYALIKRNLPQHQ
jgi:hypothetical protein